ncbi:MAG: dihydrofolate reductase family protein [Anaerolineae bacterium]
MRKIIVTEFMSLDGVIENPGWSMPYWNETISAFKAEETNTCDALLLGRVTYEGFAAAWPQSEDEGAVYMNSVQKYVVSTTLDRADWNNTQIISANVADEIKTLKAQAGKDILVYGSGKLLETLMAHDLVDSYRILLYPVVLGEGQRFFPNGSTATLNLVRSEPVGGGVMALVYEPKRA